jgi:hypothetical protein
MKHGRAGFERARRRRATRGAPAGRRMRPGSHWGRPSSRPCAGAASCCAAVLQPHAEPTAHHKNMRSTCRPDWLLGRRVRRGGLGWRPPALQRCSPSNGRPHSDTEPARVHCVHGLRRRQGRPCLRRAAMRADENARARAAGSSCSLAWPSCPSWASPGMLRSAPRARPAPTPGPPPSSYLMVRAWAA